MQYRTDPKTGNQLSILGFGCMRFPSSVEKTEQLIVDAVTAGVNYFDTAYVYSGSEARLGSVLSKHGLRDEVYIATKLPLIMLRKREDIDRFFNTQLQRLKTDHVDYYLMHMLSDMRRWEELRSMGIEDWLTRKRQEGAIRQVGFSFHGSQTDFLELLDAYDWDMCQIQYNYSDENYQAGVAGLKAAAARGLPVVVMEPLLGGKLANGLPETAVTALCEVEPGLSPAAWALRWLWDQPEVTLVLSGMGEQGQLEDNLATAEGAHIGMLDERHQAAIAAAREAFRGAVRIPCTGCNYCMPCPQGVNIPGCFSAYNTSYTRGFADGMTSYGSSTGMMSPKPANAGLCIECGKCEPHCPQGIQIRQELKAVCHRLEPIWYRAGAALMRRFIRPKG